MKFFMYLNCILENKHWYLILTCLCILLLILLKVILLKVLETFGFVVGVVVKPLVL